MHKLRTAQDEPSNRSLLPQKAGPSRRPQRAALRESLREGTSPPGVRRPAAAPSRWPPRLRCPVETAASTFQTLRRFWGRTARAHGRACSRRDHPGPDCPVRGQPPVPEERRGAGARGWVPAPPPTCSLTDRDTEAQEERALLSGPD